MKQRLYHALNRNTFLFTGGMLGVLHETIIQHSERPTLLILFAAMMGLPAFLAPTIESRSREEERENSEVRALIQAQREQEERERIVQGSTIEDPK